MSTTTTKAPPPTLAELEQRLNEANAEMTYWRRQVTVRSNPAGIAQAARQAASWQVTTRGLLDQVKAAKAKTAKS